MMETKTQKEEERMESETRKKKRKRKCVHEEGKWYQKLGMDLINDEDTNSKIQIIST